MGVNGDSFLILFLNFFTAFAMHSAYTSGGNSSSLVSAILTASATRTWTSGWFSSTSSTGLFASSSDAVETLQLIKTDQLIRQFKWVSCQITTKKQLSQKRRPMKTATNVKKLTILVLQVAREFSQFLFKKNEDSKNGWGLSSKQ